MFSRSERYTFKNVLRKFRELGPITLTLLLTKFAFHRLFPFERRDPYFRRKFGLELGNKFDWRIRYGPFNGLLLRPDLTWARNDLPSLLLGLYESQVVREIIDLAPGRESFVDIGSADGFYAAGILRFTPIKNALCYDLSVKSQESTKKTLMDNAIIKPFWIKGKADENLVADMKACGIDPAKSLILCDTEGDELRMFRILELGEFGQSIFIVEIHSHVYGLSGKLELLELFSSTHQTRVINGVSRNLEGILELDELPDDLKWRVCSEGRPQAMEWLIAIPK